MTKLIAELKEPKTNDLSETNAIIWTALKSQISVTIILLFLLFPFVDNFINLLNFEYKF